LGWKGSTTRTEVVTVSELIGSVLWRIRCEFYGDDRAREFKRDERALTKAVARWGYECDRRGWDFEPERIHNDVVELLKRIRRSGADIKYLPCYLDGAVRRTIGMRADEMSREQKRLERQVNRAVAGVPVAQVVVEKKACEVLAMVYRNLAARGRKRVRKVQGVQLALGV
jgi:hypothetical protein